MILSESEKNRIRALHRAASVIKAPLSESTVMRGLKSLGTKIYDNLPEDVKQTIEKAKKDEDNKSVFDKAKEGVLDYLQGNQGIIPGDQSELKKNLSKTAENILDFVFLKKEYNYEDGRDLDRLRAGKGDDYSPDKRREGGRDDEAMGINESTALAKGIKAAMLSGSQGAKVAKESKSAGLPKCGELLMKQATDKQKEKMDSYKDMQSGGGVKKPIPVGGITRVTMNVTLQALAGPVPPSSSGVIALKDGKPFCRVS